MEDGDEVEDTMRKMGADGLAGVNPDDITFVQYSTSHEIFVPNEKDEITVEKSWHADTGELLDETPDSVKVTLCQWAGNEKRAYADGGTVTLSAENDWSYTWQSLPKTDSQGRACGYTVEEKGDIPGFKVTYKTGDGEAVENMNGEDGIQTGDIEVINTVNGYTLPETGGKGTTGLILAGAALVAVGGVMFALKRR